MTKTYDTYYQQILMNIVFQASQKKEENNTYNSFLIVVTLRVVVYSDDRELWLNDIARRFSTVKEKTHEYFNISVRHQVDIIFLLHFTFGQ